MSYQINVSKKNKKDYVVPIVVIVTEYDKKVEGRTSHRNSI